MTKWGYNLDKKQGFMNQSRISALSDNDSTCVLKATSRKNKK